MNGNKDDIGKDRQILFIMAIVASGSLGGFSTYSSSIAEDKAQKDIERLEQAVRESEARQQRALDKLDEVLQRESRLLDSTIIETNRSLENRMNELIDERKDFGAENREQLEKMRGDITNILQRVSKLEAHVN